MSKPTAVGIVIALLLLDYWPRKRIARVSKLIVEKLPLVALSAVVAYLTLVGQNHSGATSLITGASATVRAENAAISYVRYLKQWLWPVDLACFYPYSYHPGLWVAFAAILLLAAVTATVVV